MKHYRVTRYNPEHRDSDGFYIRDDWTDINDIGNIYNSKELKYSEYKSMEDLYFSLVSYLFHKSWVESVYLKWLVSTFNSLDITKNIFPYLNQVVQNEIIWISNKYDEKLTHDINLEETSNYFLKNRCKKFIYIGPQNWIPDKVSQLIYYDQFYFKNSGIEDVFRLLIRGLIPWCKLYFWKTYIHFWYDLYIYIYCKDNIITDEIIKLYYKKWLFIEENYISPYR